MKAELEVCKTFAAMDAHGVIPQFTAHQHKQITVYIKKKKCDVLCNKRPKQCAKGYPKRDHTYLQDMLLILVIIEVCIRKSNSSVII